MRHNRARTATHNNRPFPRIDKELNFFFLFTFVSAGACFIAAAAMEVIGFDAAAAVELVIVKLNCRCGNRCNAVIPSTRREDTCRSQHVLKRHLFQQRPPSSTPAVQKLQPLSNKGKHVFQPRNFHNLQETFCSFVAAAQAAAALLHHNVGHRS